MMKRIIVITAVVMLLVPVSVFSGGLLGFRVGPTAILDIGTELPEFDEIDISDFQFGADARFNFTILELGLLTRIQSPKDDDGPWNIDALPTAGVSLSVLPLLNIGAGIGPNLNFKVGGEDLQTDADQWMDASLSVRGNADVKLGNLTVSGFGIVNSSATFTELFDGDKEPKDLFADPLYSLGVSVLFSIF